MRYVVLLIWSFLLTQLLTYVVSSMTNVPYDFKQGVILGLALWVVLSIIPNALPDEGGQEG